ncbi:hypothetical protein [Streptomyces sp. SID8352]|uniref:hypothetical protein n=1 Tax=Streptomyces sp. SID8352 TaxID=2690338 RepID=UPI001367AEC7|nr:hypothetical protein [Streptomyces sp. SID8352]MYU24643.1 hypothetical protein [Streptomyces sp. SID8352]
MPFIMQPQPVPPAALISALVPAAGGLRVEVTAPAGVGLSGVPGGGVVVGWVLVADDETTGGARVDPVFLSTGRAWTPDQYRATYGKRLGFVVGRER